MEQGTIPGLLLGDNGYVCRHYPLTPFLQPTRYNIAHKRTRNIVERLFGIWKRQFPCLQKGLQTKLDTSIAIICATAVLYNIGIRHNDNIDEHINENEDVRPPEEIPHNERRGLEFRRRFAFQHFRV
ncbi:hypothetical protein NQ318_023248 [Aromia moschata]|uniref:DDE Tnp4 domain-containing protein n=1 Tax=Aromia moschata TaxID=1265417 RepID=A0AAV8XN57_9CUCU|nr:hypothetical protein NQ318_023248 [Aromia moschata]